MTNLRLPLAAAFAFVLAGCGAAPAGSSPEDLGHAASAIQGGTADTNVADNFAVGVANKYGGMCSGTLIAPNLVLTARHCVVPPTGDEAVTCANTFGATISPDYLMVTTSSNMYMAGASFYSAVQIITPDDVSFCGNDMAVVILDRNVPATDATPATPVVQFSMTDSAKVGDEITAIGFGVTAPSTQDSGQRRIRQDISIECIADDSQYSCDEYSGTIDGKAEFVTAGWVCSGDSGSGAFDQRSFVAGQPYVLGTLSRGPQSANACLAAIYTRTDAHAQMIINAGLQAALLGGYDPPAWTAPLAPSNDPSAVAPNVAAGDAPAKSSTSGCSAAPVGSAGNGLAAIFGLAAAALVIARRKSRA